MSPTADKGIEANDRIGCAMRERIDQRAGEYRHEQVRGCRPQQADGHGERTPLA